MSIASRETAYCNKYRIRGERLADGLRGAEYLGMHHARKLEQALGELTDNAVAVMAWWDKFADSPYRKEIEDAEWKEFNGLRTALERIAAHLKAGD